MSYKMIFIDMDDTMLNSNLTISEGNKKAILKAVDNGIKVVICTGRTIHSVDKYISELGLKDENTFLICLNGGAIYNSLSGKSILQKTFEKDYYDIIFKAAHRFKVDIQAYYDKEFMLESVTERTGKYRIINNLPDITIIENLLEYNGPLTKILLNGDHNVLTEVAGYLEEKINGKLNMFFSKPEYLEFTVVGASKGSTMLELADMFNVTAEEIIAMGDSFNDLHMIQLAGLGVAMKNGEEEVKNNANYVTENTNDGDAVKEVLDKFVFYKN